MIQVFFVDLEPTRGPEQAGRRPVVVVSADALNRQPLVVTVAVGTVFLCFQTRSLDPARFDPLPPARMAQGTAH